VKWNARAFYHEWGVLFSDGGAAPNPRAIAPPKGCLIV
jgi:hypothetical protein